MDMSKRSFWAKRARSQTFKLTQSYRKLIILFSIFCIFSIGAQAAPNMAQSAQSLPNSVVLSKLGLSSQSIPSNSSQNRQEIVRECLADETCARMLDLCQQIGGCFVLVPFCLDNLEVCRDLVANLACEFEGDCDDIRECDEDEENCDDIRE